MDVTLPDGSPGRLTVKTRQLYVREAAGAEVGPITEQRELFLGRMPVNELEDGRLETAESVPRILLRVR